MVRLDRESGLALAAYTMFLELPLPRQLSRLEGRCVVNKDGSRSKPFVKSTLKRWATIHSWEDRANSHDRRVAQETENRLLKWRVDEAEKRLRERLQGASLQRIIALEFLTEDGRPKGLDNLDPRRAEIAGQYLKDSGQSERLDLGEATERTETKATGTVEVLAAEALNQLREMMRHLSPPPPQTPPGDEPVTGQKVLEGEYRVESVT